MVVSGDDGGRAGAAENLAASSGASSNATD